MPSAPIYKKNTGTMVHGTGTVPYHAAALGFKRTPRHRHMCDSTASYAHSIKLTVYLDTGSGKHIEIVNIQLPDLVSL